MHRVGFTPPSPLRGTPPNVGPAGLLEGETRVLFLPPANEVSVGGRAGVAGRGASRLTSHASRLSSHVSRFHD